MVNVVSEKNFLALKPVLTPETSIYRSGDYFIVKNAEASLRISSLAALLLSLCDGSLTVEQLVALGVRCTSQSDAELIRTLSSLMEYLVEFQMLSEVEIFLDCNHDFPRLATVYLNVTQACNLRCRYCYISASVAAQDEMSTERLANLMDEIAELSRTRCALVFSGGEPTLRRDLGQLLFIAKKKGFEVHMLTNGTLLSEPMARKFAPSCDQIGVSLDGSQPEVHETIRGRGTFERTLACIRMLRSLGINTKVIATVTSLNWMDIPSILDIPGINPGMVSLSPFTATGRGELNKHLTPTISQLEAVQNAIWARTSQKDRSDLDFCGTERKILHSKAPSSCGVGTQIISISSTGEVYPCHFFHHDDFKAGNVNHTPLKEIYLEAPQLLQFRNLKISEFKGCSTCWLSEECRGGCRASAFWAYGTAKHHDSLCELYHRTILLEKHLAETNNCRRG